MTNALTLDAIRQIHINAASNADHITADEARAAADYIQDACGDEDLAVALRLAADDMDRPVSINEIMASVREMTEKD